DRLCAHLEDQVRMNCPRCGTQLIRRDMVKHLWDTHRLVLDGFRVRDPRSVLEDWVVDYGLEKDAALLGRCRDLARKLDPAGGEALLRRMLLRHGVEDPSALAELSSAARDKHATLCPYCYARVLVPQEAPAVLLEQHEDQLEGLGYRLSL